MKQVKHPYAGRWVALINGNIIAHGGTHEQAIAAAKSTRYKEVPRIVHIPMIDIFQEIPLLSAIMGVIPVDLEIHLVGGAVRDIFLKRESQDLDFILPGNALKVARKAADSLGGAYFPLDAERGVGRVVLEQNGRKYHLDFSDYRDSGIDSDLKARDFTINAIAMDLRQSGAIYDPLGGINDIQQKIIKTCANDSFVEDPVRILRGIRFAAELSFKIDLEARHIMRDKAHLLSLVSPERIRDELFKILGGNQAALGIRALEMLGILDYILPELRPIKGVEQSSPHLFDVWEHTLKTTSYLEQIFGFLISDHNPDITGSLVVGVTSLRLGRYREQLIRHFEKPLVDDRILRSLLFFACLYHDVGKAETWAKEESGRIRFIGHEKISAEYSELRGKALHLSNAEITRLRTIAMHHMRPMQLGKEGKTPTPKAIYRFFRDTGESGIDICLLSLADMLGIYGPDLNQEKWNHHVDVIRHIFDAYWEDREKVYSPSAILNGEDVMKELGLTPGPLIGKLLEQVREAQVDGLVATKEEAIRFLAGVIELGD